MKSAKIILAIGISVLFLASLAYCQTTEPKVKTEVTPGDQKSTVKDDKNAIKKATATKSRPAKPKDVPDIPLKNSRIVFGHTTFDFGTVPGGSQVTHHFPVRNEGVDTLIISKIKAG